MTHEPQQMWTLERVTEVSAGGAAEAAAKKAERAKREARMRVVFMEGSVVKRCANYTDMGGGGGREKSNCVEIRRARAARRAARFL